MPRNIAKQFKMTLSLIDMETIKPKYRCFYGEDVELIVSVRDESNQPVVLDDMYAKVYYVCDGKDLRQDDGITFDNNKPGNLNILVKKKYINPGTNTVRIVLFDDDQEVYLQPAQIECKDTGLSNDNNDTVLDDVLNIKDEFIKVQNSLIKLESNDRLLVESITNMKPVDYQLTLQNNWVSGLNGYNPIKCSRYGNIIYITGTIFKGVTSRETVITNVPTEIIPTTNIMFNVTSSSNGSDVIPGFVYISKRGELKIFSPGFGSDFAILNLIYII